MCRPRGEGGKGSEGGKKALKGESQVDVRLSAVAVHSKEEREKRRSDQGAVSSAVVAAEAS